MVKTLLLTLASLVKKKIFQIKKMVQMTIDENDSGVNGDNLSGLQEDVSCNKNGNLEIDKDDPHSNGGNLLGL